jgi:hypothetical protein
MTVALLLIAMVLALLAMVAMDRRGGRAERRDRTPTGPPDASLQRCRRAANGGLAETPAHAKQGPAQGTPVAGTPVFNPSGMRGVAWVLSTTMVAAERSAAVT